MNEKMQSKGITEIGLERMRQVSVEGFGAEHDAQWVNGELVKAAISYLIWYLWDTIRSIKGPYQWWWPWDQAWWKPKSSAVRNLARAGALIAAEIDRIDLAGSEKSE